MKIHYATVLLPLALLCTFGPTSVVAIVIDGSADSVVALLRGPPVSLHNEAGACDGCTGGAETGAIGLVSAVVIISVVGYMVMSPGPLSQLVLKLIDCTTSIFLAVLWFEAVNTVLSYPSVKKLFPCAQEVLATVLLIFFYTVVMWLTYRFRDHEIGLVVFAGSGAHFVAFAAMKANGETQYEVVKQFGESHGPWIAIVCCFFCFGCLLGLFRLAHVLWFDKQHHDKLHHVVEEMELDILGLAGSWAITLVVLQIISGKYHPKKPYFLQVDFPFATSAVSNPAPTELWAGGVNHTHVDLIGNNHTHSGLAMMEMGGSPVPKGYKEWHSWFMLFWALGLTIIAVFSIEYLGRVMRDASPTKRRAVHVARMCLVMTIAWGYLLWGEWLVYDKFFAGHDPMVKYLAFAIICTVLSLVMIAILAQLDGSIPTVRQAIFISINGASLVAAFAWEKSLAHAINVIANKYKVGWGGLVPKTLLAFLIPLAVLPLYVTYIKPIVMEADADAHSNKRDSIFSAPKSTGSDRRIEAAKSSNS
mmetsp:Transcript_97888/g.188948  ORF Transcript_97888/g.188948 Transcript_97888/m.188948 type:complete len:532 (-) Transcript_97888:56-1651(-)